VGRRYAMREHPKTDLQSRLVHIKNECDSLQKSDEPLGDQDIRRLAYLVSYLAGIVDLHFRTGEK